jgi:Smg protein
MIKIMFEVLMYLFENYMDGSVALNADQDTIVSELEQAGFNRGEIGRALDWLDGLNRVQETVLSGPSLTSHAIRHYAVEESERLGLEGRGFLLYLEQLGILDPMTREVVIDRLMALDHREVDLGGIKWVVLIALFNQPDKKSALSLLQDMILSDAFGVLH